MNNTDLIAIITREAEGLANGEDMATATATILNAASNLLNRVDPQGNICARLTHNNGRLIGRYAGEYSRAKEAKTALTQ